MPRAMPSALVTEEGRSVRFRLQGKYFELSYDELRTLLGLPPPVAGASASRSIRAGCSLNSLPTSGP